MAGPTQFPPVASAQNTSDLMLVERTIAGDQRAFELLVIKYQSRIQRLIGRMVRDADRRKYGQEVLDGPQARACGAGWRISKF